MLPFLVGVLRLIREERRGKSEGLFKRRLRKKKLGNRSIVGEYRFPGGQKFISTACANRMVKKGSIEAGPLA